MNVRTYIPPPGHPLALYLQSIWRVQARGAYSVELILPKGNVDILFNLSEPLRVQWSGGSEPSSIPGGAYLAGMQTRGITSHPQGEVHLLGISFKAEVCASMVPVPLYELTDHALEGTLVVRDTEHLRQRLGEIEDFDTQTQLLIEWLLRRVAADSSARMIEYACTWLSEAPADAGITTLARSLGYSPRHLRRLFLQHVGVTPGHYLRLSRFVRSLHMMSSPLSLTEIAHSANYFDQAHFCRDFKEIAGITAGEYREKVGPAPGHIFTP